MTSEGFFFYPFSPSTPVEFSSLRSFIESFDESELNSSFIEGEIGWDGAKNIFMEHFSTFPYVVVNTTISSL
jgi:hypothetical protein